MQAAETLKILSQGVKTLAVDMSNQQLQQLVALQSQLIKWNRSFNLTAIEDPAAILRLHLLDSLSIVPYWRFEKTLDIGTGAGFPGLPLAIALPDKQFHLIDSNAKKTRFIQQQIHHLGLTNVTVFHARIGDHPIYNYPAIVSRAFASIEQMLKVSKHLLSQNGSWMAMKGSYPADEIKLLPDWAIVTRRYDLQVPGLSAERCLIEIRLGN